MIRHATRQSHEDPPAESLFKPPSWHWTKPGEIGWWVRPEWHSTLIGPSGLRIDEWRDRGQLTTIKTGPNRVVYRADLAQGSVFVKHFLVPSWREKLRQWFRRGKGRNEGRRALKLAGIGVPTITPIALGEQRKRAFLFENYLITPAIPDSVPLDEFVETRLLGFEPSRRARVGQALAFALGELTAHLHDAGFVHQDFHPGNLLVRLDEEDRPQLAMIDLDALRVRRDVSWKDAKANLALLNNYFWTRCDRTDRLRFLSTYLKSRRGVGRPPDLRTIAAGIETATRSWAEKLWRRWGRRCRGDNKYFKTYRESRCWAVASRDLDRATVSGLMNDPDEPFSRPDAVVLKDSRTTTVAQVTMHVEGRPTPVIYKRFNRKKVLDPVLNIFRPSRAWRAWQNGQHLDCRAVPTPRNLIVIGESSPRRLRILPHHFWSHDTYLATVKAEPSITVGDYALTVLAGLPIEGRRERIRRFTTVLARLIRTMHERSLSHRDLKAANILIVGDPDAISPILSLIDLVGVTLDHPIAHGRRVQNLARLQISLANVPGRTRTDALRFLRAYLPWIHTSRPAWKGLWRDVERACRSKELQNRKRGRVLS
ncbi:MAG: Mn2+-dependent serine/threonine protein kinase [Planctomycetota bacterium]|nr:Mn2+-dependent serine/threonine protein kinase [Planctomycetota bacterium]